MMKTQEQRQKRTRAEADEARFRVRTKCSLCRSRFQTSGRHRVGLANFISQHRQRGTRNRQSLKERIAEEADTYAFLFEELGVDAKRWEF